MKILLILLCTVVAVTFAGHTAEEWKDRVIYQLLVDRFAHVGSENWYSCGDLSGWCSGNFQGLIDKLDYITGMGFNAIWISPVVENTDGGYHGYWAKDIYAINSHYGTSDDLKELVAECHKRDVWVMVDVVANHMGYGDISEFYPFDQEDDYHYDCEITDWNDPGNMEYCRLAGLPDLAQENDFVKTELLAWIKWLVDEYDLDGIRIDTIPHVPISFWSEFSQSAGVYTVGEYFTGNIDYLSKYVPAIDAILNYGYYYAFLDAFAYNQGMWRITDTYNTMKTKFSDLKVQGSFCDNHDNERFLYKNSAWTLLKQYILNVMMMEGIPIIYYGTEQGYGGGHDPANRESLYPNFNTNAHLYQFIKTINTYRAKMGWDFIREDQKERYVDQNFFAFTRHDALVITTNVGDYGTLSRTITYHPYSEGTVLVNVLDTSDKVTVYSTGIHISISNGQPKFYLPQSYI